MIRRFFTLAYFLFFAVFIKSAPIYTPLQLSGFNADVVCSSANCIGTKPLDEKWFYYSADKKEEGALPQSLVSKSGVQYELASFEENNALIISKMGDTSGSLKLKNPVKAKELWLLGLSADGRKDIDLIVKYTDNTVSDKLTISFPDWFHPNGSKAAYYGLGRCSGTNSFDFGLQFGLFERIIPVDEHKTVESISFEYKGTDKTYTSIFAVSAYQGGREESDKILYMISNAHFDTQWDWDVQTSIDHYVKNTLEGNFNLFEKYPNYKFNFEGAIKYKFAKEYYPDLYERLKGYIAAGRWHASGSSVDANDVMVPSAESFIRNLLLGHVFFKKEFNVDGGNDIMLPDCFGFPHALPTLAAHCGMPGFHSQKLSWGSAYDYDAMPHFGLWKGVDGSEIYAVHKPGAYVTQYKENLAYSGDVLNEINDNKLRLGSNKTVRYFGTGDKGGSVDESTADWLEKSMASDGPVKVKTVTPDEFFASFTPEERAALPVWDKELPMRSHGVGCYTSQTILKYWNRKGELLADATEKASVLADWLGGLPYQKETINQAWTNLLWHQFHDDLPGTCIPRAYVFTYNDHVMGLLGLSKTMNSAVGAVSRTMNTQTTGMPIVVYNPLSIRREDIVEARVPITEETQDISVYNADGQVVPTQKIKQENGFLEFIFKADVPSLGYAVYDLRLNDDTASRLTSHLKTTVNTIENESYILKLNKNGDVFSILDKKQANKELLSAPIRLSMQANNPGVWASWEISWEDVSGNPFAFVDKNVEMTVVENGPLRAAFMTKRKKNGSEFVQLIRMTSGVNADRIDFVNEVDWQSKRTLLKVIFPLTASNPKAVYDGSIGVVERTNHRRNLYEVAGHQWADVTHSDASYGVSILNDCKYGWDKPKDNELRLTLIHTPETGEYRQYEKYQDLGLNKFTYSFYRHLNTWDEKTQWEASKLNQPLVAYQTNKHTGSLGKKLEFVKLNTDKVAVKALKQAELSDEIIIRVYELTGNSQENVELSFMEDIIAAREVNGREQALGTVGFTGNKILFNLSKYQPKTFAVKLKKPEASIERPISRKVALEYNIDVMSTDKKIKDGRFGTSYYAYPAELFADTLIADGIEFAVGPREDKQLNAIVCKGQQITLPQDPGNRKIYILAASQNMAGSEVEFKIDGVGKTAKVAYFAEQLGSWGTVYGKRQYRKENVAFTATHRHNYTMNKNDSYAYLYIYKYMFEIDANAQTLTLPDDKEVIVFAVTVSDNINDDIAPLSDVQFLPDHEFIVPASEANPCGERLIPSSVKASGRTNMNEHETFAADNNPNTKWNDNSSAGKFIQYNFNTPVRICQWNMLHAGLEGDEKITADFTLQTREGSKWIDIDEVKDNTENQNIRQVTPFETSSIRVKITKPHQQGEQTARVYSFDVFGNVLTGMHETSLDKDFLVYVNENHRIVVKVNFVDPDSSDDMEIFDIAGKKVFHATLHSSQYVVESPLQAGAYMVRLGNKIQKVILN